jgi:hypothetical protein
MNTIAQLLVVNLPLFVKRIVIVYANYIAFTIGVRFPRIEGVNKNPIFTVALLSPVAYLILHM